MRVLVVEKSPRMFRTHRQPYRGFETTPGFDVQHLRRPLPQHNISLGSEKSNILNAFEIRSSRYLEYAVRRSDKDVWSEEARQGLVRVSTGRGCLSLVRLSTSRYFQLQTQ